MGNFKEVSQKQEHKKLYLNTTSNINAISAATGSSIVGDVSAQGSHLLEISNLIVTTKAMVDSLSAKVDNMRKLLMH